MKKHIFSLLVLFLYSNLILSQDKNKELSKRILDNYITRNLNYCEVSLKFLSSIASDTSFYKYSYYTFSAKKDPTLLIKAAEANYIFKEDQFVEYNDSLRTFLKSSRKKMEGLGYYRDILKQPFIQLKNIINTKTIFQDIDSSFYLVNQGTNDYYINKTSLSIDKIVITKNNKYGQEYWEYSFNNSTAQLNIDSIINYITANYSSSIKRNTERKKIDETMVGQPFPEFEFISLGGIRYNNQLIKGKYVMIDLFYQSCLPCIKAIPKWIELKTQIDTSKAIILGVDPVLDDTMLMYKFVERYKITYDVINGPEADAFWRKVNNSEFPYSIIINPEGKIEYIMSGYSITDFNKLKKFILNKIKATIH